MRKQSTLFAIKSKGILLYLSLYLPKRKYLGIIKYSKKWQQLTNITIEDYEIYSLQFTKKAKIFNFKSTPIESITQTFKSISELTASNVLLQSHKKIQTPWIINTWIQLSVSPFNIVAATNCSWLIINSSTFSILNEIPAWTQGEITTLIDLGNNLVLTAVFIKCIQIYNLSSMKVIYEISGNTPCLLRNGWLAYTWQNEIIRIINIMKPSIEEIIEIQIYHPHSKIPDEEDTINMMIELRTGDIALSSWNKHISVYSVITKEWVMKLNTNIMYIDYMIQWKDNRFVFIVQDNAYIYCIKNYLLDDSTHNNISILSAHTSTVVQVIQLEHEQLLSVGNDGKIIYWVKDIYSSAFFVSMIVLVSNDWLRKVAVLEDGRIVVVADEKIMKVVGLNNEIGSFQMRYVPGSIEDKTNGLKNKIGNYFEVDMIDL